MFTSINDIDKKLFNKYSDFKKKDGLFIEAGANDGKTQSNTYYFQKQLGWKGILIEPMLKEYEMCHGTRGELGVGVINGALDKKHGEIIIEYTPTTGGLMSVVKGLAHTSHHLKKSTDQGLGVAVKTYPLSSLIDQYFRASETKARPFDFMSLDVEGYETQALQGWDMDKHPINYLLIEMQYYPDRIRNYIKRYYQEIDQLSEHDYLFKRR